VLQIATTDDLGHFRLAGLDPLMGYMLYVAGKGLISFDPLGPGVSPSTSSFVEVHAKFLYGTKLVFRDADGSPPKLAPGLNGRWHGDAKALDTGRVTPVFAGPWLARLIGLDEQSDLDSTYDRVCYFQSSVAQSAAVVFEFASALPGYDGISARIDAPLVVDALSVQRLAISQSCDGFGSVVVAGTPTEGMKDILAAAGLNGGCRLRLRDVAGAIEIEAPIRSFPDGAAVIDGIPHGEYEATFLAPHQLMRFPMSATGMTLGIGHDPAAIRLPLSEWGGLSIDVETAGGFGYDGCLSGTLTRVRGGESDELRFAAPPYFVPLLPAGDYVLELRQLEFRGSAQATVEIQQGRATRTSFRIED
jgi:hypothetical protein